MLHLQMYPKTVFQVSRFRNGLIDDNLAIPGVPNFIAFEGVPLVFTTFGVPSGETSADWCAAEKHVKDWLLKEQPHTLSRNLWLDQRSSHMRPQGSKLVALAVCAEEPRSRSPRSTPQEASDDSLVSHAADKEAVSRLPQHKTHEQLVDYVCAVGTEHQQHTDALSQQLVHEERLCAMQQAQLQQLKRKCEFLGRELVQAREAWAERYPGERHGRRYFSARQGTALAARAVATNSAVTQLGVQMGTQIHRSTMADGKVMLHVAIQAFKHELFAELSSRVGAEMLPLDDGAPEATCVRCSHHSPHVGRYE